MKIQVPSCKVISAFPGVGKTYFFENSRDHIRVSDSDSSGFPKDRFPDNYIEHIQSIMNENQIILVSSHENVRAALRAHGIEYVLVYPMPHLKDEYLSRYRRRGSPESFLNLLNSYWDYWVRTCEIDPAQVHIRLRKPDETLSSFFTWWDL